MGDLRLAERILRGDRAAGERLVRDNYPRIYRLLRSLTGSEDTAQDLAQQTFVDAWQALGSYRGEARLSSWLHRVAYHEFTHWRRDRRECASLDDAALLADPRAADGLTTMMLRQALARLSAEHREAFVLCHVQQMSVREAAVILGVPEGTVKSRAYHARQQLRAMLTECAVDSAPVRRAPTPEAAAEAALTATKGREGSMR